MKRIVIVLLMTAAALSVCMAQTPVAVSPEQAKKDSLRYVKAIADSLKMEKLFAIAQYPFIKGSKWSGVIPVSDPAEIPDPMHDYKLLFELTDKNPDSLAKEINRGLDEVARVLNLHVASGIPPKKSFR